MALTEKYIEKVRVGGNTSDYDHIIAAKYISATTTNSPDSGYKTWKDITDLVPLDTLPTANESNYNKYKNDIILIPAATSATGNERDEYIILKTGTTSPYTYKWEKIGTTAADLATKADKGTYTSSAPSTNATGSAGGQTATGAATVTYDKASNQTQSTGSTATSNTSEYAGTSVSVTGLGFSGTKATLSLTTDYQPAGTISKPNVNLTSSGKTVVTGGTTASVVTGVESAGSATFVKSYPGSTQYLKTGSITGVSGSTTASKATAGTAVTVAKKAASATTVGNANVGTTVSFNAVNNNTDVIASYASVSDGVLTFTDKTASKVTTTSKSIIPAVASETTIYGVGDTVNITPYTFTDVTVPKAAASASNFVTGLTTTAATGMGVLVGLGTATTGTAITGVQASGTTDAYTSLSTTTVNHITGAALAATPTFTGTTATLSVSTEYTPAGSITGGSVAIPKHSHTYVTLPAHTHDITLTATTITGTAEVAVASHTHSLGNHTHSTTI